MRLDPLSRSAAEQAALVREGRLSARELVDAALAAIERGPGAQRVRAHLPGARARGGRRDRPRRPAPAGRRADRDQGPHRAHRGPADRQRQPLARRLGARRRLRAGGAAARGRRDRRRQDQHARVGDAARHRARALRPGAQPVGPGADHRRLLGRQRRRGRGRHGRRSRTATTPAARSASRRPAAASSGSSRPASACRSAPSWPRSRASASTACSRARCATPRSRSTCSRATGPSTPLGPPLPPPPFAEAAAVAPHPLRIRLCTTRAGRRRGRARVRRRRPRARPPCSSRSGTRSTSGRPTGRTRSSPGTGWRRARAMFQAPDRALRRARRPRARPRADGARHARAARRAVTPEAHARGDRGPEGVRAARARLLAPRLDPAHARRCRCSRARSAASGRSSAIRFSTFLRPFNVTGQPAISLPLHRTPDGVPVGVQLAGPVGSEARLLSLAGQLEAAAPWPLTADARAG